MFPQEAKYGPRLRFYLCHFSSEDEANSAEALRIQDRHSCGWATRKHTSYPQELGFHFDGVVDVESLRILANESKISSCIDVYVAEPTAQEEQTGVCGTYVAAPFKRLGHIRFSTNEASGYRARELKTVGLRRRCTYLKLVLRNPHANIYNIFQQVGIVALVAHGRVLQPIQDWMGCTLRIPVGEQCTAALEEMLPPPGTEPSSPTQPSTLSTKVTRRIAELKKLKQQSVTEEDFDRAAALKQQVTALEQAGRDIAALDIEKQRAVAVEDYALAKQVKLRIQAIQEEADRIASAEPGVARLSPPSQAPAQALPPAPSIAASPPAFPLAANNASCSETTANPPQQRVSSSHDEVVVRGKGYYDLGDATGGITGALPEGREGLEVPLAGGGAAWERSLNSAIQKVSTIAGGPAPLIGDDASAAKPFTADVGVYCAACLFSRKGQQREAAVRGAVSTDGSAALASHSGTVWSQLMLYLATKGHGIGDPVAGAAIAACSALTKIVQEKLPGASAVQVAEPVTKVLPELVARLGESNTRVQESVEKTLVAVARSPLGHRRAVELLLVDPDIQNRKPASVRAHVSRIHILSTFVDEFGLSSSAAEGLDARQLCSAVLLPGLQHSNADVREAAIKLMAKLLCRDPSSTGAFFDTIKPAQQALVEEQVERYKESQQTARSEVRKTSDIPSDSIEVQRPPKSRFAAAPRAVKADEDRQVAEETPTLTHVPVSIGEAEYRRLRTCQFCGEYNAHFNEQNLDVHYVSACPMLCPCPLCDQVTEICQLQQHLVTECEKRRMVRECTRCHEAVRAADYTEHVAAKKCIEAVPSHSVCPLCHARFKSGMDGWRHHLAARPGCPNNPRKFDGSGLVT